MLKSDNEINKKNLIKVSYDKLIAEDISFFLTEEYELTIEIRSEPQKLNNTKFKTNQYKDTPPLDVTIYNSLEEDFCKLI